MKKPPLSQLSQAIKTVSDILFIYSSQAKRRRKALIFGGGGTYFIFSYVCAAHLLKTTYLCRANLTTIVPMHTAIVVKYIHKCYFV